VARKLRNGHAVLALGQDGKSQNELQAIRALRAGDPYRWACALARPPRLGMLRAD
jgi:hypothetical protein